MLEPPGSVCRADARKGLGLGVSGIAVVDVLGELGALDVLCVVEGIDDAVLSPCADSAVEPDGPHDFAIVLARSGRFVDTRQNPVAILLTHLAVSCGRSSSRIARRGALDAELRIREY